MPGMKKKLAPLLLLALLHLAASLDLSAPAPAFDHLSIGEKLDGSRMKVYIYDLPPRFNHDAVYRDVRCLSSMFALEIHMHLFLLSSSSTYRTLDPDEADWFYTPVYTNCELTDTGLPLIDNMPDSMTNAIHYIASHWPYWNRTDGRDHFFVVPHDFGACFHFQEKKAIERGILPLLRKATLLQTFGEIGHPCFKNGSIVVPPYISARKVMEHTLPSGYPRSTFAYFRGEFYDATNDAKGGYYSRGVRGMIWENFKNDTLFDISSEHRVTYYEDMQRSIFCLCPLGWAPWSPRIVESVTFGCIPVIIADNIVLPFKDVIPWEDIAVFVAEKDVSMIGNILKDIPMEEVTKKQRLLQDSAIKEALLFPRLSRSMGDAFHQVMNALARKLPRDPSTLYIEDRAF